jgi:hypothetical protein
VAAKVAQAVIGAKIRSTLLTQPFELFESVTNTCRRGGPWRFAGSSRRGSASASLRTNDESFKANHFAGAKSTAK